MEILSSLTVIRLRFGIQQRTAHTVHTLSYSMTAASSLSALTIDQFGRTGTIGIAFRNDLDACCHIFLYNT